MLLPSFCLGDKFLESPNSFRTSAVFDGYFANMNIWSTFRSVPPIAPEAMAWAVVSFGTFLAASEYPAHLWGRDLDPLALAIAVHLFLSVIKNLNGARYARAKKEALGASVIIPFILFGGIALLALFANTATAAKLMIIYVLMNALIQCGTAAFNAKSLDRIVSTWGCARDAPARAVMLEGLGLAVCAATLTTVWMFSSPLAFVAMSSFGLLVLRVFINWLIVLYLIDQFNRHPDGDDRD